MGPNRAVPDLERGEGSETVTLTRQRASGAGLRRRLNRYWPFYLFILPGITYFVIFRYWPMYGIRIAFYDFGYFGRVFRNTIIISAGQSLLGISAAIVLSLLLNEVRHTGLKRSVQTIVYLPHFLSWVVVASIFTLVLSPRTGIVNNAIKILGGKPVRFLTSDAWWRPVYFLCALWKESGWGTVVFLAALRLRMDRWSGTVAADAVYYPTEHGPYHHYRCHAPFSPVLQPLPVHICAVQSAGVRSDHRRSGWRVSSPAR